MNVCARSVLSLWGGANPFQSVGRLVLHIVPLASVMSTWLADLDKVLLVQQQTNQLFRPMGREGCMHRFNFEGFMVERSGGREHGYTQIFRNGALEATRAAITGEYQSTRSIPQGKVEKHILQALPGYLNGLRDIGIPPPLVVLFTFEGVKGAYYAIPKDIFDDKIPVIERDVLHLPDCLINDYGTEEDYHRAVKPAFDALWNTAGCASAESFSSDGTWVGNQRR